MNVRLEEQVISQPHLEGGSEVKKEAELTKKNCIFCE